MPKKSSGQDSLIAGLEQIPAHVPEMMLALSRMQGTIFDAVMRQNIEVLDFLKARFERDRELAQHITHAADPADAVRLWAEFWQKAASDYAGEPARLSELMQKSVTHAVAAARHDTEDIMHVTKATAV